MSATRPSAILLLALAIPGLAGATSVDPAIVQANNEFACDLYAELREDDGNLFFSPYSVYTALAMTQPGARGLTAEQIADVLHFFENAPPAAAFAGPPRRNARDRATRRSSAVSSRRDQRSKLLGGPHASIGGLMDYLNASGEEQSYELVVANALWGQENYPFLDRFLGLINTFYDGGFHGVDFIMDHEAAREEINDWVAEQTRDRIEDLLQQGTVSPLTRLVLTNAIYFKSAWYKQFAEEATQEEPFWLTADEPVDVPMMKQLGSLHYMEGPGFQLLELPYENGDLSMLILLPDAVDGLPVLEQLVTAQNLALWLDELDTWTVDLTLPRFEVETRFVLNPALSELGMPVAFTNSADFSGINGKRDLFIGSVVHKAFVNVDEEGTEAAAATGVTIEITSMPPWPWVTFRADRPFLFLIREVHTGAILFVGRVVDPR